MSGNVAKLSRSIGNWCRTTERKSRQLHRCFPEGVSIKSTIHEQKGNRHLPQVQSLQLLSIQQKKGHDSALSSRGLAEIDDAKAAATARTIAEEKRIVREDMI